MIRSVLAGVVTLGLVVGFLPPSAEALCIPKHSKPANPNDAFAYLDSVIDGLGWAKQGLSRVRGRDQGDFVDLLSRTKAAGADYSCAATKTAGFADSSNEIIQKSAVLLASTYEALASANQKFIKEIVDLLDQASKNQMPGMGTMLDRLTNAGVMMDEVWKTLPLAVIGTTYTLPVFDGDRPTGRVRLSRAQRQQLMHALEGHFGPSVRAGMQAGQHALDGAAGVLYQFLADRKWRSADDP